MADSLFLFSSPARYFRATTDYLSWILGLQNMDPVQKAQGIRSTLGLCGVFATLWFVSFATKDGDFSWPEEGYKRLYLFSQYFRAFFLLAVVCLYGFFQPASAFQPNQNWLFRILALLLLQYQLFAMVSLQAANDSCASPPWQTDVGLLIHSVSEPALDCWLLLISQGWGTGIFTGTEVIYIIGYGFLQFMRRFMDPVLMFKFSHILCQFDSEKDYDKRDKEAHEIQTLIKERDELAYVDFALCVIYWSACLYWAVQAYIQLIGDPDWNQPYRYLLGMLGVLAGTDLAAYLMEVFFMDWGLISYQKFLVVLEVIEYVQLGLLSGIIWLWRPQKDADQYAQVPADDPTFNYMELNQTAAPSSTITNMI